MSPRHHAEEDREETCTFYVDSGSPETVRIAAMRACLLAIFLGMMAAGTASAQSCQPGSFSVDGNEPCTECGVGSEAPNAGSMLCSPCAAGTYAPDPGTPSCLTC